MKSILLALAVVGATVGLVSPAEADSKSVPSAIIHHELVVQGPLRYDTDFPALKYGGEAKHNRISRLQERLERGEVKLEFKPGRGYLDSLLKSLDIDPSSQLLVYSKTSLQADFIRGANPRALYFNDDTSIGWENGAPLIEVMAMDSDLGVVFYALPNREDSPQKFDREGGRCLNCHDRYGMMGGGSPIFVETSTLSDVNGLILKPDDIITVDDQTPIAQRWAGWYVTGQSGKQTHLGNIQAHSVGDLAKPDQVKRTSLDTLDGLFDTHPYITNKSDIVALLVLEHESTVYNLITRLRFKLSTIPEQEAQRTPQEARMIQGLSEKLVQALVFIGAAPLGDVVKGSSGFDSWFQAQGPRDSGGRSLRELDLRNRVFKYPLSFLIYSAAFDGLAQPSRAYVYQRLNAVLSGQDTSRVYAGLPAAEKQTALEILRATKPEFTASLNR